MNERIQELHEQAMKSCDEHRSDILNYHRIYREKFAELIVNECVIQCEREWIRHGADSAHNQAIHGCINSIKKHFGVEE